MADIITRLVLKSDAFDANLKRAKGSVNSFQSDISSVAKTAGAGVLKFAGTLGIAVGGIETLGKIMGSQQSTQDDWDNTMFAAKMTVDKFFTSINTGDWTSFQNGLMQSFAAAKNLSAEIDALNDKRLSLTYIKSEALAAIEENKAIAMDTTQPLSVRRKAFEDMQNQRIELEKKTNATIKKETDVLINTLKVKYGDLGWIEGDVIDFVVNTNFTGGGADFAEYKKRLEELKKKEKVSSYNAGGITGGTSTTYTDKSAVERTKQFKLQNIELEKQRILEQEIDESRQKTVNLLIRQAMERRELSSIAKSENRIKKQIVAPKEDKKPLKDTLAWYDAEISRLNKELMSATTMQARAAIQTTINELEKKKVNIKIVVKKIVFEEGHEKGKEGQPNINRPGNQFGLNHKNPDFKLPKFELPVKKEDIDLNKEYAESLGLIGSVMGNLSGVTNDSASAYLQWGANVLSSISMAIPLIMKLTTAKTAEAAAEAASSAAKVPFVGWMAAAGAALSVVATMASIPKFANGGIVPGISFSGDRVPAMVNSGEMILNGSQQANLFKILNSKLYSGLDVSRPNISPIPGHLAGLISPSPNGQKVEVSGNFKVRGQDLELVLNNRSRIKNKIR